MKVNRNGIPILEPGQVPASPASPASPVIPQNPIIRKMLARKAEAPERCIVNLCKRIGLYATRGGWWYGNCLSGELVMRHRLDVRLTEGRGI